MTFGSAFLACSIYGPTCPCEDAQDFDGGGRQCAPLQSHALCQVFEELQSALELQRLVEQHRPVLTVLHLQEEHEQDSCQLRLVILGLLVAAATFKSGMLVVARASFRHNARHRTHGGLNGGGFRDGNFSIINCGSGAIFTLIKFSAFTWQIDRSRSVPAGSTSMRMFNVGMGSTLHLKPVSCKTSNGSHGRSLDAPKVHPSQLHNAC